MTEADRIAIQIKNTRNQLILLGATPVFCILDEPSYFEVIGNTQPCDPPDYDHVTHMFCGLHLICFVWPTELPVNSPVRCVAVANFWQDKDKKLEELMGTKSIRDRLHPPPAYAPPPGPPRLVPKPPEEPQQAHIDPQDGRGPDSQQATMADELSGADGEPWNE